MNLQEAKTIYPDAGQVIMYADTPVNYALLEKKAEETAPNARILHMSFKGRRITIIASTLAKEEEERIQAGSKVKIIKALNELISYKIHTVIKRQEHDGESITYIHLDNGEFYPTTSLKLVTDI
jgi:hypothetical protein